MSFLAKYVDDAAVPTPTLTPVQALNAELETVSIEAFKIGDLGGYIARKSNQLSMVVSEGFKALLVDDKVKTPTFDLNAINRKLAGLDYLAIGETELHIPVGFSATYLNQYIKMLEEGPLVSMNELVDEVLVPAQKFLSYYINNPDEQLQRHNFNGGVGRNKDYLANLISGHSSWFAPGSRSSTRKLEDLFENKNGINHAFVTLSSLNRGIKVTPDKVNREVAKLSQLAQTLFSSIDPSTTKATPQFLAEAAQQLKLASDWVSWYAAVTTQLLDVNSAMKHNEKLLLAL